jgi:predicted nucleic acid-binding protein
MDTSVLVAAIDDYQAVLIYLAQLGIIGGAIYDALIAYAASKAEVEQIVTFNEKHFRQVYPALCERIVAP